MGCVTMTGEEKPRRCAEQENGSMKISDRADRDLQLLRLLVARQLDGEACGASMLATATTSLETSRYRDDRQELALQFEMLKGLRAAITDTWWEDGYRDMQTLVAHAEEIASSVEALCPGGRLLDTRYMARRCRFALIRSIVTCSKSSRGSALPCSCMTGAALVDRPAEVRHPATSTCWRRMPSPPSPGFGRNRASIHRA
jgi:hypothetical protein